MTPVTIFTVTEDHGGYNVVALKSWTDAERFPIAGFPAGKHDEAQALCQRLNGAVDPAQAMAVQEAVLVWDAAPADSRDGTPTLIGGFADHTVAHGYVMAEVNDLLRDSRDNTHAVYHHGMLTVHEVLSMSAQPTTPPRVIRRLTVQRVPLRTANEPRRPHPNAP